MKSIGEALVSQLVARGVDTVFGIPGVHTLELYRGLAASGIRHVTPRHEQGAGFMADGYARATGKVGVAFVITGPGVTNTLTAMGQARADSVPMLVISGVNTVPSLGKGYGFLHELPDQRAMVQTVAVSAQRVEHSGDLTQLIDNAFKVFETARPGPVHIEIPLDIAGADYVGAVERHSKSEQPVANPVDVMKAAEMLAQAKAPVILVGGGARWSHTVIKDLSEKLSAPVVQTVNARGILFGHLLSVPASPSLQAVRDLIEASDIVLAVGTELGPTDFDMYATGTMPKFAKLIRIDVSQEQLDRRDADLAILGGADATLHAINDTISDVWQKSDGAKSAARARALAFEEIGPEMRALCGILGAIRDAVPNALLVGDSTYPIYAGNLYYDHDRAGGWFNAATGFGALGYGIPAAIGAAIGAPDAPVICITGDGGAQFSLPELMCAVDEKLPITFVIWNNHGYQEIATSMQDVGVTVLGCDPSPPDFEKVAQSCNMPFWRCNPNPIEITTALQGAQSIDGPRLIEIQAPNEAHSV